MMILLMLITRSNDVWLRRGIFTVYLAICCLLLLSPVTLAHAAGLQSPNDIRLSVEKYIHRQFSDSFRVSILVDKLDPYLRLANCDQPLEIFYPPGARRLGPSTVGVRCFGTNPWQIYVPVQVKAFGPAIVCKRALPRGTIIDASDLTVARRELSGALQGYYSSAEEIIGMELRYSLAQGDIIGPKSVKPRHLVKRGDTVTILAETSGLRIRSKGKALMDGFRGQSIRVKNTRSDRVIEGEVVALRTVRIKL